MAAFGSPVLDRRMKYGSLLRGPLVVSVHFFRLRWNSSATPRHTAADVASPFLSAISAAAISPAISADIVDGEKPDCSSQRSLPNDGPWAMTKSAAGLMWSS